MHKLSKDQEGPVDIVFLTIAEWITPFFHATGHTPNIITTYSLISALVACYYLWKGHLMTFIVLYLLAYLFDCVDGYMARRYNQITVFGDYYDHVSDNIKYIILLLVIVCKYPLNNVVPIFILLGVLGIGMCIYMGCSQKSIKRKNSKSQAETLDIFQSLCASDTTIQWAKYFSCGTIQIASVASVVYLELCQKKKK
jgi:phosphatidylglycerophosphate synthase